ncbi:MAG: GNAT family protein [Propionicimonas sp.]|nr:GNAT family protein [Propionicimonas sp.]
MRTLAELPWPRHTARLELRPAVAADTAGLWRWHRLPEVTEWMTAAPSDLESFAARVEARLDDSVTVRLEGRIVGSAKLHVEDGWAQAEVAVQAGRQQCEVGWVLDPAVQGRGLGTELARELLAIAFDGLGVRRVVALCFADNTASWKVMQKLGMRQEGRYRAESLHRSGRWLDGMTWAILADEWRNRD